MPGGARWGHALGFALAATLLVELVTGLLLMTTYSPSAGSAWGSVYFISYQMDLGWFVRGLHRFGSFASVVVGGLLLLRLVLWGAYRAPRELNWWLAVGAFLLILVLGVTGNILPWDQRGYWAAVVEMTIAGGTPVVGPAIKKVVVGGSEFGNQTLTRIYGLHVAVLPGLLAACSGATTPCSAGTAIDGPVEPERAEPFWPGQAFYDIGRGRRGPRAILVGLTLGQPRLQPRRPGRPVERRLPGPARVVLPPAQPAAEGVPRAAR